MWHLWSRGSRQPLKHLFPYYHSRWHLSWGWYCWKGISQAAEYHRWKEEYYQEVSIHRWVPLTDNYLGNLYLLYMVYLRCHLVAECLERECCSNRYPRNLSRNFPRQDNPNPIDCPMYYHRMPKHHYRRNYCEGVSIWKKLQVLYYIFAKTKLSCVRKHVRHLCFVRLFLWFLEILFSFFYYI